MPTTDILIRTCSRDAGYHRYCMESIAKFCTGFRGVAVILKDDPDPQTGYLDQQITKLEADLHTDADFILTIDSDTLFTQPVTLETFMHDGKPIWLFTPWTKEMLEHPGTRAWHDVMQEFVGVRPPAEHMRRHPFMFPRTLTQNIRNFCQVKHGMKIRDYIMRKGRFSEFNVMGFYASFFMRESFHWINTEKDELPPLYCRQFWSWDPVEKNLEEIERILA